MVIIIKNSFVINLNLYKLQLLTDTSLIIYENFRLSQQSKPINANTAQLASKVSMISGLMFVRLGSGGQRVSRYEG